MSDGDRLTKPNSPEPSRKSDDSGPVRPTVPKPGGDNELMRRMKRVDPEQAKKYRQRSGQ
ncbi:MAG: ubiquitin-like protein UBact [Armatimonadetes bacterium]|nr:ubiquitin-like protein UBact [Armatimonadota bacterium]